VHVTQNATSAVGLYLRRNLRHGLLRIWKECHDNVQQPWLGSHHLVGNVFFLVSLIVGLLTGSFAIIIELSSGWIEEDNPGDEKLVAFTLGFVLGLVLCSILMSVIASSVNAVLVLFGEKPAEFQQNHPELSAKMREIWSQTYPGSV